MDAVKFIEERNRMCKSFGGRCNECPGFDAFEEAPVVRLVDGDVLIEKFNEKIER